MKLTKVIEILELNLKEAGRKMHPDTASALGIAVEAVKRLEIMRISLGTDADEILPGETED
ncbi:unnamed protein product [marine sediment metagenome]|uniref:Uncharacterized protein n=1 Tax=marine sediment metagenome TaxID=412755 RepID=X1PYQ9_9ZZZZ